MALLKRNQGRRALRDKEYCADALLQRIAGTLAIFSRIPGAHMMTEDLGYDTGFSILLTERCDDSLGQDNQVELEDISAV